VVRIATAQEEHGGNKRLIRVRYLVRPSGYTKTVWGLGGVVGGMALLFLSWPYAAVAASLLLAGCLAYVQGSARGAAATLLGDAVAADLGLVRCEESCDSAREDLSAELAAPKTSA
jgi:hypothetical protein